MRRSCLLLLAAAFCAPLRGADADAAASDVSFGLFDGKSLAGWTSVHDAKFSAQNGVLSLDGGMGWLRTDQRFRDFTLRLEWRALGPKYDSGIYFRAPLEGKPWPPNYQVNLRHDEVGKLVAVDGAGGPTPANVKAQGEWNHLELRVVGKEGSLKINGVEAWKTQALQERDGFLGIQAEEHKFEFRDITIAEHGYTNLLESFQRQVGKHLVARGAGDWELKNGVLVNAGAAGGWLGTTSQAWADFSLKLDYKLPNDGNSGIFLRCPPAGNPTYEGLEIQLVDDDTTRWQLKDVQRTGAIYAAVPPRLRATRSAGTWEAVEITTTGGRLEVRVNGHLVVDVNLNEQTRPVGEAKCLKDRPRSGCLGLQSYGTGAYFRNLRAKKI